ncbi:unnamed protein product, partial [Rotaria socialis]
SGDRTDGRETNRCGQNVAEWCVGVDDAQAVAQMWLSRLGFERWFSGQA